MSIKKFISTYKVWTGVIIVAIIFGGYEIYSLTHNSVGTPQYTVARARIGSIIQTVTGTGQVSASNQLDLTSQVSGMIKSIDVKVGQQVNSGDLIATIDATNALNSLNNAKLSLAKLTESAKPGDISNAQNSVVQSYDSAFNSVSSAFTDLPNVISGMKDLLYGQTGFLSDQRSTYLSSTARTDRDQAGLSYDQVVAQYNTVINEYRNTTRTSATSSINTLVYDSYNMVKNMADALKNTQNTLTFISTTQPDYNVKDATAAEANVNSWSSQINSDLASIVSSQNSIQSTSNTLNNLIIGTDPLDVQSAQLSLQQAEQTYSNYFIRAPFDGIIGRIPVNVYGQASGSTVIATIIGNQKIATLSLNEVDAATVKTGDPVTLTFDAINNFTATGTVSEVDLVGTVSSGVVTYAVKVTISTNDAQINPGMSVNAIITTQEIDNVLVVPSAAVKTQGKQSYVQVIDPTIVTQYISTLASANGAITGSSTRQASTTRQLGGNQFASSTYRGQGRIANLTISSDVIPTSHTVTIGSTDSTNTEIQSGLTAGEWVVTKTTTASATTAKTTTAPSLLSSIGAGGRGGGGGIRPGN